MANVIRFFMGPEDERAFFREIATLGLELYPEVVDPDWQAPAVEEGLVERLDAPAYYLAAPGCGPIQVDKIKRGPNKGKWMILEIVSPVIHYERSLVDPEDGSLRSGRIWAELQVSGNTERREQKPVAFERVFRQVSEALSRRARRSQPVGYLILPDAVRLFETGTELRETGRKGKPVRPYR